MNRKKTLARIPNPSTCLHSKDLHNHHHPAFLQIFEKRRASRQVLNTPLLLAIGQFGFQTRNPSLRSKCFCAVLGAKNEERETETKRKTDLVPFFPRPSSLPRNHTKTLATQAKGIQIEVTGFQIFFSGTMDSGFQSLVGFRTPTAVFRIPKPRILDSTSKNFPDSGIHIPLNGVSLRFLCFALSSLNLSIDVYF